MRSYGTLKAVEDALPDVFFRVNNQTIVNLRFVTHVGSNDTTVAGRTFPISRGRRKEFLSALHLAGHGGVRRENHMLTWEYLVDTVRDDLPFILSVGYGLRNFGILLGEAQALLPARRADALLAFWLDVWHPPYVG